MQPNQFLIDFDNYPEELKWTIRRLHPDPVEVRES